MKLTLPWPPSVNSYWQSRVIIPKDKGRAFVQVYVSEAGQAYAANVLKAVTEQLGQHKPIPNRLSLRIRYFPPDRRDRDFDNPLKALCDAMAKASVYVNDK